MEKEELKKENRKELDFIFNELDKVGRGDIIKKKFGIDCEAISTNKIAEEYKVSGSTIRAWINEECKRLNTLVTTRRKQRRTI
jgi:DNA invertase Pin-like site-specific DNA recombinase